jgi:hypothetical protein
MANEVKPIALEYSLFIYHLSIEVSDIIQSKKQNKLKIFKNVFSNKEV